MKVRGGIDVSGTRISNVEEPVNSSDAATMGYVLNQISQVSDSKSVIVLKCPWQDIVIGGSCMPPECPEGWEELTDYNEITGVSLKAKSVDFYVGNTCRICTSE